MSALPLLLIGGTAVAVAATGKKKKRTPEGWLRALAKKTGNPDYDPSKRDPEAIIIELQTVLGVEPADGKWSPQLAKAVKEMYREL